jgi:SAM-dependent methyltransferase
MNYHLKPGYSERAEPEYWVDETGDTLWQPDVYLEAASLAERLGAGTIIDVGCGSAAKLIELHPAFEIVGVDYGPNIEACRAAYPFGEWLESDFDSGVEIPVQNADDAVVVCSDVIEHVRKPERLLHQLRSLLDRGALALILTTPERNLRRGTAHVGPPPNVAHTREWALEELQAFMADEGLEGHFGLTRTNDREPFLRTNFAVIPSSSLGAKGEALESWWAYRERWQAAVLEHEKLVLPQRRVRRRVGRLLRRSAARFRAG